MRVEAWAQGRAVGAEISLKQNGQDSVPEWDGAVEREEQRRVKGPKGLSRLILNVSSSLTTPAPMLVRGPCLELPLPQGLSWAHALASPQGPWLATSLLLPRPWYGGQVCSRASVDAT